MWPKFTFPALPPVLHCPFQSNWISHSSPEMSKILPWLCHKRLFSSPWGHLWASFHAQLCLTKCPPHLIPSFWCIHLASCMRIWFCIFSPLPPTAWTAPILPWVFLYPRCLIRGRAHKGHSVFLSLLRIYQKCRLHSKEKKSVIICLEIHSP